MKLRRVAWVVGLAAVALGGCTIERTKALGAECLQSRECVSGACLPGSDGRYTCMEIQESGLPAATDATPDTNRPADALEDTTVSDGAAEAGE